jgi:hypothetical protein
MAHSGFKALMEGNSCKIYSPSYKLIGQIPEIRGLYRITPLTPSEPAHSVNLATKVLTISQLHRLMGHINHDDLRRMVNDGLVTGVELDSHSKPEFCDVCVRAKVARKPFPKHSTHDGIKAYGDKIVSDVWGPAQVRSLGGHDYLNIYHDISTSEERPYFLHRKSEALDAYEQHKAWVKTQRGTDIRIFGCDRGGEFMSKKFSDVLKRDGTIRHLTVHDSPASNGTVERSHRTHLNCARAMLIQSGMPNFLWAEAIRHSVWLRNRSYTRAPLNGGKTPHESSTGNKPDLSNLIEWGSRVWVKVLGVKKLEPRAVEGVFVGYDDESKGYRIYWPGKRIVSIERDVYYNKNDALLPESVRFEGEMEFGKPVESEASNETNNEPIDEPKPDPESCDRKLSNEPLTIENGSKTPENEFKHNTSHPTPPIPPPTSKIPFPHEQEPSNDAINEEDTLPSRPRRAAAAKFAPGYYKKLHEKGKGEGANMAEGACVVDSDDILEPGGVVMDGMDAGWFERVIEEAMTAVGDDFPLAKQALEGPERELWEKAMKEELDQIEKVQTWTVVAAPKDLTDVIDGRWALRRKRGADGNIIRYKARFVVRGFKQQYGIDYTDTFAPTVRPSTLRILLSIAAHKGSVIVQADAKNAYLHGILAPHEVIHMKLPEYYTLIRKLPAHLLDIPLDQLVCRIWRPLYGSKQGAHHFYQFLIDLMRSLGYTICSADEAVFYKFNPDGTYVIYAAATDDFTIIADSDKSADSSQDELSKRIELVKLGRIHWLLGNSVERDLKKKIISLGQEAYINQVVARFNLEDARPASTPLQPNIDLTPGLEHVSPQIVSASEKTTYREMIGSLMYLSVMTRPDITYAVTTLSQHLEAPSSTHLQAARRVIRYLKGTKSLRLVLGGDNLQLSGYSDADWGSQLHRHSISGFSFFLGNGAISWSSKKQPIVTLSSTESEYVALTHSSKDIIWIQKLLSELRFIFSDDFNPTTLFCDNQGAIRLSKDSTFHARTKHIDIHFHFIRQTVAQNHITLSYCSTNDMIADIFTKSLSPFKFEKFRTLLGVF